MDLWGTRTLPPYELKLDSNPYPTEDMVGELREDNEGGNNVEDDVAVEDAAHVAKRHMAPCPRLMALTSPARVRPNEGRNSQLNQVKRFNNWNVCSSCRLDITQWHRSMPCPQKCYRAW